MTESELANIEARMQKESSSDDYYANNYLGDLGLELVAEVRRLREVLGEISTACENTRSRAPYGELYSVIGTQRATIEYVWELALRTLGLAVVPSPKTP